MKISRKKGWRRILGVALGDILLFFLIASIFLIAGVMLWVSTLNIPDLSSFENRKVQQSTKIYDRTGEILLYDLHQDIKRTVIPYEEMSDYLKKATVAIEDERFYSHNGIDIKAIFRAIVVNIIQGKPLSGQGGSTITQQVIKNSLLDPGKKITRKVKEWILSVKLERMLSKDEILAIYLNESPYGGTLYGVEEAAQTFFGKPAKDVTLAEAAYLAALPQSPSRYSPYGNNKDRLDARKNQVLERMYVNDMINHEEYTAAREERVEFQPSSLTGIKAPHFVMYVRDLLEEQYGEEALAERGFKVITSLDYNLQKQAEEIVAKYAEINDQKFNNASNAAMVATDPTNGDLLVMVGSRDYFSETMDGNYNVTTAERQPGSVIKPFVYATAFKKGYLPNTILFDVKTQFSPLCEAWNTSSESPCFSPDNYNHAYRGPVSMRNALASSLNIPAVKTLYLAGIKDSLKTMHDMGMTTLNDPDRYGLTLVLGGGEVKLLDITNAYGVFANEGIKVDPRAILKIEDSEGKVVFNNEVVNHRVLDENVARMISDVLNDNVARTPLWGARSQVYFGERDVASKTGSTNNLRDAWLIGYTPNLVVGTWVGDNDNKPMSGGLSGLIVTPMWREFIDVAIAERPVEEFTKPTINLEGVKPIIAGYYVDASTILQQLTNEGVDMTSLDLSTLTAGIHNILYYVNRNDPRGAYPTNPAQNDDAFNNWEYGVQIWKNNTYGALLESLEAANPDTEGTNTEADLDSENDNRNSDRDRGGREDRDN